MTACQIKIGYLSFARRPDAILRNGNNRETNDHLRLATFLAKRARRVVASYNRKSGNCLLNRSPDCELRAFPKTIDGTACTDNTWTATAADEPTVARATYRHLDR